jgi:hypothetical protein
MKKLLKTTARTFGLKLTRRSKLEVETGSAKLRAYCEKRQHRSGVGVKFFVNRANPPFTLQADGRPLNGVAVAAPRPGFNPTHGHEGVEGRVEIIPAKSVFSFAHARQNRRERFRPQARNTTAAQR